MRDSRIPQASNHQEHRADDSPRCSEVQKHRLASTGRLGKEKLERIIREELFKKRYLDILFGFQTRNGADSSELISDADETAYASRIKNKLRTAALNIGYDIEQLITVPDLKPLKLRDKFSIVMDGSL